MDINMNPILELTDEQKKAIINSVQKIQQMTAFLSEVVKRDCCTKTDTNTHMALLRHEYDDLAAVFGTDGISEELDRAHAECRHANTTIRALQLQLGAGVTAEKALSRLSLLESAFETWYQLVGFRYVRTEWHGRGLTGEIASEIEPREDGRIIVTLGDQALADRIQDKIPFAFDHNDGWQLKPDGRRIDLLDMDENRMLIKDLIKSAFPNADINGFSSHSDHECFLLRTKIFVPWTDIEAWLDKFDAEGKPAGACYLQIQQIKKTLEDKDYLNEIGPALAANLRKDLARYETAATLYEELTAKPLENNCLTECVQLASGNAPPILIPAGIHIDIAIRLFGKYVGMDPETAFNYRPKDPTRKEDS